MACTRFASFVKRGGSDSVRTKLSGLCSLPFLAPLLSPKSCYSCGHDGLMFGSREKSIGLSVKKRSRRAEFTPRSVVSYCPAVCEARRLRNWVSKTLRRSAEGVAGRRVYAGGLARGRPLFPAAEQTVYRFAISCQCI